MDELMQRHLALSQVTQFDRDEYVLEWYKLARDFDIAGRPAMAEMCRSRGEFYGGLEPTQYTKVQTGVSHVELVQA